MWDWRFIGLLLLSTVVDYIVAKKLPDSLHKKRLVCLSACVNLGILGMFKYFNFFADTFEQLLSMAGLGADWPTMNIILPVGISFYTFQTLGYVIDVYRNKVKPEQSLINFAVFVSFFPQLVAGPIERAEDLLPQIQSPRKLSWQQMQEALYLIVWGLVLKVVIADNVALVSNATFAPYSYPSISVLPKGLLAFSLQIFADFAGYSSIARGIAGLMGFRLSENFRMPYISATPQEFWARWHITLSRWFKDYVYFPLGGSKNGKLLTVRNVMITMFLSGLWHGASWTFVLWGLYHGVLIVLYRVCALPDRIKRIPGVHIAQVLFFFLLTMFGWLLFRAASLGQIYLSMRTWNGFNIAYLWPGWHVVSLWIPVVLMSTYQVHKKDMLAVAHAPAWVQVCFYYVALYALMLLQPLKYEPFIYFRF